MRVVRAAPSILLLSLGLAACAPYEGGEDAYDEYADYGYGPYDFGMFGFSGEFEDFEVEPRHSHQHHHHADGHGHMAGDHHHAAGGALPPPGVPPHGMNGQTPHRFTAPPRPPSVWYPRGPTVSR